jgi:hypothetical protein
MGSNSNATQGAVIVVGVHFLTLYAAVLAVKGGRMSRNVNTWEQLNAALGKVQRVLASLLYILQSTEGNRGRRKHNVPDVPGVYSCCLVGPHLYSVHPNTDL